MKKVAVVSTGGTIAMKTDKSGFAVPTLGAKELIESLPNISGQIDVRDISFRNIPSAHMTYDDLLELRSMIINLKTEGFDGVVITHGTDTMEETAYFFDLTIDSGMAIVLTGAQRNPSSISSDVQLNLMDSILVAADDMTAEMGAVIVFSSEIIPAREATKFHRSRVDTFKSLEFGPIGAVNNNRVLWFRKPIIKNNYGIGDIRSTVDIIPCYLGSDSRMIENSIDFGVDGIILQSLGAGHMPRATLSGVKKAIDKGIPTILTSRVPLGRLLTDTYGFEGSERYLRNMGVIFGEDLSAIKARIKLLVLLSFGYDFDKIKNEFEKDIYQ